MKFKLILSLFLALNFLSANASINPNFSPIQILPRVIYGEDNRMDVYECSDSLMVELSKSTAAQISDDKLIQVGDTFALKAKTLTDIGLCPDERFASQPLGANCSGFLISPDTLVTAGHCVTQLGDCQINSWVFDYANTDEVKSSFTFNKNQVFHCTEIIAREQNYTNGNDFAIVKLDRPVPGRTPLKVRKYGKPADDAVFTVIGHPTGVPTKITVAADMRNNSNPIFFQVNSDTYGGNSGSAVVDSRTGIVEGILVRGDQDYEKVGNAKCSTSVHRDQDKGRGEDVTRITNIKDLLDN